MSRSRPGLGGILLAALAVLPCRAGAAVPVESVALIDVKPGDQSAARQVLEHYLVDTRADPGLVSIELLLQAGTSNHFILLQRFREAAAADAHARMPFVVAFRAALFPHLGSPYDERFGGDLDRTPPRQPA